METRRKTAALLFASLLVFFGMRPALAEPLQANAAVEKDTVFLGEPFVFQIQVSGSEHPEKPDVSGISDFTVQYRGGQRNSSSSITIINGKMTRNVQEGYVFSYQLAPKRTGRLVIPPITVHTDRGVAQTSAVAIRVQTPTENDDFKLRLQLSKDHGYVGEPVVLTVTWYLGAEVRGFNMSLPILEDTDDFYFDDPQVDTASGGKFFRIPLSDGQTIAQKGQERLDGKDYATITFQKILIPKKSGRFTIEPATVVCEVLTGYTRRRNPFGDDFFSDFFNDDFFGGGRQGVYRKEAVPSNGLSLTVSEVPEEGKPANFAGHVGEYAIRTEAAPTDVRVGDPITLKITLSGPAYLEHVDLPPLNQQAALKKDFRIPRERAIGETSGNVKVFTQTIRPLRAGIQEIPPVELPYFDTRTGTYRVARSAPIPISVKAARVVTVQDAEGSDQPAAPAKDIETWTGGIAFNYEDPGVIENQPLGLAQWMKSPAVLGMTVIPPLLYAFLFLGLAWHRRRHADPAAFRARGAYRRLLSRLKEARRDGGSNGKCYEKILDALRQYLGDKLNTAGGALTFRDVRKSLEARHLDEQLIERLKDIFDRCEAGRYAGGLAGEADPSILIEQSESIAKLLEKTLR